ncbi:hypothetical protein F4820DRAFT_246783 [Hypoxylon rubiginosum]|uniref:Uncharacterized protein n=1 Tax=Hypoxylon rubiginosum TaxID=110542 RepID=A0ACB9Z473_9PEZI|nr:hypothetical protein F4820DRAFT_246783 [Hypoxylon rubiginosum]
MLLSHLPRELRDLIYTFVCLAVRDQPDPSTCRKEDRKVCGRQYSLAPTARDRVWFERRPIQSPLLPLLLVSRQVSREAKDVLCGIGDSPNCMLDIMFLKDESLWPTWLSIPKLQRNLGTVYTQVRIFHVPDHLRIDYADDLYNSEDPGPPPVVWLFHHLLASFLRNGPLVVDENDDSGGFTVQTLILDFLPASEKGILPLASFIQYFKEVDDMSASTSTDYDWMRGTLDESLLVAEYLAHFIRALFLRLLNLGPPTMKYGKILYENVGDIEIWVNGRLRWCLDIPKLFSDVVFNHGVSTTHMLKNEQRFKHWKETTSIRRANTGLTARSVS